MARFQSKMHKKLTDLQIDFNNLQKDVCCTFHAPVKGINSPRPYGLAYAALLVETRKSDPDLFQRRKEAFLKQLANCWVRSFTEEANRYYIVFW